MKTLLLAIMLMASATAFSQHITPAQADSLLAKYLPKNTTFDTVYADIRGAIAGMAAGLKTTGDHVYEVLVYQQLIEAIKYTVILLITVVMVFVSIKAWNGVLEDDNGPTKKGFATAIISIITGILLLTTFCHISTIITGFFNPEYGAIQEIIRFIQ